MPSSRRIRAGWPCAVVAWLLAGCIGSEQTVPIPSSKPGGPAVAAPAPPAVLKDEIPSEKLQTVVAAHLRGLGHMERYEYEDAATAFREVLKDAPGWIPGSINLSIALLNQTGVVAEQSKKSGGAPTQSNFEEALSILSKVIERAPDNLHAHYCKGIILAYLGELAEAHKSFEFVTQKDPSDAHAWLKFASTMTNPEDPTRPMRLEHYKLLIPPLTKALDRNPYLVEAIFRLERAYTMSGDRAKGNELRKTFQRMNPGQNVSAPGEETALTYGEMGKYGSIVNPFKTTSATAKPPSPPRFELIDAPAIGLAAGETWVSSKDLTGDLAWLGRIRSRFGAGVAAFDANGDGKTDLYLTAAIKGPKGIHDALLINKGDGKFEDASASFGIPTDRPSIGVAAGDFDADQRIDLFVTGAGSNRLLRNVDGKRFEDVTGKAKIDGSSAVGLTARWLDLDQDGDLDLYVVNLSPAKSAGEMFHVKHFAGTGNVAYRNDGVPSPAPRQPPEAWVPRANATKETESTGGLSLAFTAWPEGKALEAGDKPHVGVAALDVDGDRDLDLIVADEAGGLTAILNDRLGAFHTVTVSGIKPEGSVSGLLIADLDKDGRSDLVVTSSSGKATGWRNATSILDGKADVTFAAFPVEPKGLYAAAAADVDLDTYADLVGISSETKGIAWARNEGARVAKAPPLVDAGAPLVGFVSADLVGDALPDLFLIPDGAPPRLAKNPGNGQNWLSVDLGGRWHVRPTQMRTNPHGIGTRMSLEGQGLYNPFEATTVDSGLGQSVGPIVLGMGEHTGAPLLRLKWPDQVMQCELNVSSNQVLALAENSRKTGSCPVLFTWNGERFVCMGDFLGGGGLGYLVAPGVYGEPDRDEAMAISADQLKPVNGVFRLSVTEPMDEVAYLDKLTLDVVDRPPGVETTPDERFAPEGPRPTGELIAWSRTIAPAKMTDHKGVDRTQALLAWDRNTADGFAKRKAWIGYAEDHSITLDFGGRLARFGPKDRLVLCLAGWVEYPYSQTNYAAATAGVALKTPILERRKSDGTWEVIDPHPGYPAGLPRMMTVDVTGKLTGPECVLRIRTNMECYWDQAFVAVREDRNDIRVASLPVSRAELGYRGYTREISPDGKLPLLYDYDYIDPAPLARLDGKLTRYGDVAKLLNADDDQLCLVGPGDEVRLEFDAKALPPLPEGWTRSYVLRSIGYCKDADPFTNTSDTVGPLPYKGMPAYPFGPDKDRPKDPAYKAYLETFQTR